ncbi:MAG: tetratricopeptide repeat protein [Bergeyella sp.]|nr:tetratricopeptide repeat protein [Bergeyella sp.]
MGADKSKREEGKGTVEFFKDLDKEALKTEKFIEKNARVLTVVFGVLVFGVLGYFAYDQFIAMPKNEEATQSFFVAEKDLIEGKYKEALGGKAPNLGFLGTYKEFSDTPIGKLSAYNAGLIKFREGKYQEAYDLLDHFSSKNKILLALKYGAMADCQSNLNKNEEALSLLDKASSISEDPYTSYYFVKKAGVLSLALGKRKEAKEYFAKIAREYDEYDEGSSDSYIEMTRYY